MKRMILVLLTLVFCAPAFSEGIGEICNSIKSEGNGGTMFYRQFMIHAGYGIIKQTYTGIYQNIDQIVDEELGGCVNDRSVGDVQDRLLRAHIKCQKSCDENAENFHEGTIFYKQQKIKSMARECNFVCADAYENELFLIRGFELGKQ